MPESHTIGLTDFLKQCIEAGTSGIFYLRPIPSSAHNQSPDDSSLRRVDGRLVKVVLMNDRPGVVLDTGEGKRTIVHLSDVTHYDLFTRPII